MTVFSESLPGTGYDQKAPVASNFQARERASSRDSNGPKNDAK